MVSGDRHTLPAQRDRDSLGRNLVRFSWGTGIAIAIFTISLLAFIAAVGWSANNDSTQREHQQIQNAIDQSTVRVLNELKSVAWWDDAVRAVEKRPRDLKWINFNFGVFLTQTYGQDEVYVVDAMGRPAYAFRNNVEAPASRFEARRTAFAPLLDAIATGQTDLRVRDSAFAKSLEAYTQTAGTRIPKFAAHILTVEGRPAILAAISIMPNVDMRLTPIRPQTLLSLSFIDDAYMRSIGTSLLIHNLRLVPSGKPTGQVAMPLAADDGRPLGMLVWQPRKPGQIMITVILPLVAAGMAAVAYLLLRAVRSLGRASRTLEAREREASFRATHDELSGLPNRRKFSEMLRMRLDPATGPPLPTSVGYIDIDRFKDINDTLGHHAGDELIVAIAARLHKRLSSDHMLARFGGDEFAVLCNSADPNAIATLSDTILEAFADPFQLNGQELLVTGSAGFASTSLMGESAERLMRNADIALYEAKEAGRNRSVVFSAEMAEIVAERHSIETDLRAAIRLDQLYLCYQPIISAIDLQMTGVEALLRWNHPLRGDVSPAVFVPIAERAGLMPELGAWVLEQAFREAATWPQLQVAINLSPVQFRNMDLAVTLDALRRHHQVDPRRIQLEITEGVLMDATEHLKAMFAATRDMGFRLSLDDFGTGYSGLSYLRDFNFDKVKIDRSFIRDIDHSSKALTILQAVVLIAKGHNMTVVAEGVETETEEKIARLAGCDELQGFRFSRPVPAEQITAMLQQMALEHR
jgi:diguanylate cyclase (GGDEF)-like protein